ncbi:hypothetical protein GGF40_002249 [Coemansia sp. RSA 1286]|nr:hypothetical protein GGF40_002249 [Coemansia sp. RSA 1286]
MDKDSGPGMDPPAADRGQPGPLRFQQHWDAERQRKLAVTADSAVAGDTPPQSAFADFVVSLRFATGGDRAHAAAQAASELRRVVTALTQAGLDAEVRQAVRARRGRGQAAYEADAGHVLVFVSCPRARLLQEWRRARLHDWLGGMVALRRAARDAGAAGAADPYEVDADARDDPARLLAADAATADEISVAERQRLVHRVITGAADDGGAAVRSGGGVAVLALHDAAFNREWVRHWARKWLVDGRDLRRIRAHFGEEIALYFAFLQSYFLWLALPAAAGVAVRVAGGGFAWPLAAALVVWTVVFTETWARREADIATFWGVHGVEHAADSRRAAFRPDAHVPDPATGEPVPVFSPVRRWARRALGVGVIAALASVLAALVAAIFALQTFFGEFYAGPLASVLGLAPVVLFSACLPAYTAVCTRAALALTEYENYEYETDFAAQLTVKLFVFRFLQDQLYLFLTAWVFVPYRDSFERWLSRGSQLAAVKSSDTPATAMVQTLLAGFVVTSQALSLVTETAVPLALRWWTARSRRAAASASASAATLPPAAACSPAQLQFIARAAEETRLPEYSTFEDYAEMASQFGRVAFFSVAWPLAPLAAFVNNWFELRGDAAKIAGATQRPIPRRVESIGPWLGALRLMCWLASITNALLVYQFNPATGLLLPPVADPDAMKRYGRTGLTMALVVLLFAEHAFLAVRWLIIRAMASWPSAYARIVDRDRALSRRRWLDRAPLSVRDLAFDADADAADADTTAGDWRAELDIGLQAIDDAFKTA